MKKRSFPQVLTALFGQVLRKKHALVNGPKTGFFACPKAGRIWLYFQRITANSVAQLGDELALDTSARRSHERPDRRICTPDPALAKALRINFRAPPERE